MSLKQNVTVEATLGAVDRLHKQIAEIFFEKPHYLDGNPRKDELIQMLTAYLDNRKSRFKSVVGYNANRACAIKLSVMLDELDKASEANKKAYARKIAQAVFEMSEKEQELIPEDIMEKAFMVAIQYFNHS